LLGRVMLLHQPQAGALLLRQPIDRTPVHRQTIMRSIRNSEDAARAREATVPKRDDWLQVSCGRGRGWRKPPRLSYGAGFGAGSPVEMER
jgi:hypothetical protein